MRLDAPVQDVRSVSRKTTLLLWVRAGGRCEFDGCNEYLFRHHVTLDDVNLAELAHIVAFKPDGPRGNDQGRPGDIHAPENLMLLCQRCHKLIDDQDTGKRYTRAALQQYKREHEERILRLTAAKPERKTTVVEIRAKVGGQVGVIPRSQIFDALAPMYPSDEKGCFIDLTAFDDDSTEYYQLARRVIEERVATLYDRGADSPAPQHISVFGLAAMPLLMVLGSCLSNKGPVELYQKHRDTQDWTWKTEGPSACYQLRRLRGGSSREAVALVLSMSAALDMSRLPAEIDARWSVYEITLAGVAPNPMFLERRGDLIAFRRIYQEALALILRDHGAVESISVFPAVPAPLAIVCGFELFPKVSPVLRVFENDVRRGGWVHALDVGRLGS